MPNSIDTLRRQLAAFLNITIPDEPVPFQTRETAQEVGYTRSRLTFPGIDGDLVPAFLLLPAGAGPFPAVLVHHQHHGQRHLGKSEVCGLAGDPLQAFGPALAQSGFAVLAPDSICFEDRRKNQTGIEPHEDDVTQHFNEMCYRLLRGDSLMRVVLGDSARAITLLQNHPQVDAERLGILGHSYGGNTVLFHAPLDERIRFACSSGAACSYRQRMAQGTGIEMSQAIPGFAAKYDIGDLLACMAPRPLLIVSADEDKYSQDAAQLVAGAQGKWRDLEAADRLEHYRYQGGHALTQARFEAIVRWLEAQVTDKVAG